MVKKYWCHFKFDSIHYNVQYDFVQLSYLLHIIEFYTFLYRYYYYTYYDHISVQDDIIQHLRIPSRYSLDMFLLLMYTYVGEKQKVLSILNQGPISNTFFALTCWYHVGTSIDFYVHLIVAHLWILAKNGTSPFELWQYIGDEIIIDR